MKSEKKAWFILFSFVFVVGICISGVNYFIDCANRFNSGAVMVAEGILNGNAVYFTNHPNERENKKELIKQMPKNVDTVAIGASLLMTVNHEMLGLPEGDFYNLGASGMNLRDYLNTLGLMEYSQVEADNYIFLLHIDVFLPNTDTRSSELELYGDKYSNYLDGYGVDWHDDSQLFRLAIKMQQIKSLFSIAYFRDNIHYLVENKFKINGDKFFIGGFYPEYAHYMSDGSWVYADSFIKRTVADVLQDVESNGKTFMPTIHTDSNNFIIFDKIIQKLLSENKKIILYYPPYCPSLIDAYPIANSPCFKEIETWCEKYINKENITILGNYNPRKLGLSDENYYDARHIRREDMPIAFRKIE